MTTYEAPAKLNLSLLVFPPRPDGYHPLESLVQTVEWCDLLHVDRGQHGSDTLRSDIEDNLVERALRELRKVVAVPPLDLVLEKDIPVAAGLGGGSSDAAAALLAGADAAGFPQSELSEVALIEVPPRQEGMTMVQILSPKKEAAGKGGRPKKAAQAEGEKRPRKAPAAEAAAAAPGGKESGR